MMPKGFTTQAARFMHGQIEKYGLPSHALEGIASRKAQELADKLGASKEIVRAGTALMDCQLGEASAQGKAKAHMAMGADWANGLFGKFPEIPQETRQNILACITEHHGTEKFTTLESEVCCNADCYKFASVEGFFLAIRFTRDLPLDTLIKILGEKVEEKWKALSLDVCRKELEPQYKLLKEFLKYLPSQASAR